MYRHIKLAKTPFARSRQLLKLILSGEITLAGYCRGKIYGTLSCKSGKRMKAENRVFFGSEQEAQLNGYRPCAHCLPEQYKHWKSADNNYKN